VNLRIKGKILMKVKAKVEETRWVALMIQLEKFVGGGGVVVWWWGGG